MGVRQHLSLMEKDGLIYRKQVRRPIGRPNFIYGLTEKADSFFPKTYETFAKEILNDISRAEGKEKVELLFKRRQDRIYNNWKGNFDQKNLFDRSKALVRKLNELGLLASVTKNRGQIILTGHNCPIYQIAKDYRQLCRYDRKLCADLLGADVKLTNSLAGGDQQCEFIISEPLSE